MRRDVNVVCTQLVMILVSSFQNVMSVMEDKVNVVLCVLLLVGDLISFS